MQLVQLHLELTLELLVKSAYYNINTDYPVNVNQLYSVQDISDNGTFLDPRWWNNRVNIHVGPFVKAKRVLKQYVAFIFVWFIYKLKSVI